MIRKKLPEVRDATFVVHLPDPNFEGFPAPTGTGFFVSSDGLFLTARHVITKEDGTLRDDINQISLSKELRPNPNGSDFIGGETCTGISLVFDGKETDVVLLRADVEVNKERDWFKKNGGFPFVRLSSRMLEEGEPVFSFGYPLSNSKILNPGPEIFAASINYSPRVTSAIVASTIEFSGMLISSGPPLHYVLDKALNYGNSGGPIASVETGCVYALCSRFQPLFVEQKHLGTAPSVMMPSLYGIVVNLANPNISDALKSHGVNYSEL